MTLDEFRNKVKHIEQTHPVPNGWSDAQKLRYHSKLCFEWIDDLPYEPDGRIAMEELRLSTKKAFAELDGRS